MRIIQIVILFFSLNAWSHRAYPPYVERHIDEIVSLFENSTPEIQYGYIENLHDGRGFTAGKVGFTTGTGDLVLVAEAYLDVKKDNKLFALLPILQERAKQSSESVEGLETLPEVWKVCATDPSFNNIQDRIADELYRAPARDYLKQYNLKSPLAYLIFYDSLVQHGNGDGADSFGGILDKMKSKPTDEKKFLNIFLTARKEILLNPADAETAPEWRESVDRVYALLRLLKANEFELKSPLKVRVWDEDFVLK